ncbi:penicillin-binding protein [Candidatus Beckwithbacteria bacterium CG10_big_fil_rev_8_21_14_0_10_34_10]|uniref:Penicillin-binding protein n=1 Tax=Candidatus Beckwithbacteria bacterium CG10_big_fil_rev_8_21_14_0_10_34_10 TaxID=1974495 RepID=A0A2H0W842_9BACT|nr:MAG: penicillin-binding protein [Candidatus Beckwithbacteria bacterium CG10_big_fil_rev_8_21_14_0_10_34_10]
MVRLRTGKKLLAQKKLSFSLFYWIQFILQSLGRLVYKFPLFLIKYFIIIIISIFSFVKAFFKKLLPNILKKTLLKLGSGFKKSFLKTTYFFRPRLSLFLPLLLLLPFVLYFYIIILKDLPGPNRLINREPAIATKIYDRQGELLFTIFNGNQKRTLIKLEEIPDYVIKATISIEDKEFYQHTGFSLQGILRAIIRNLSNSSLEGGSTITQQLIKNALLTPEKTVKRKLKEIVLSIETEIIFSKDEILQMYLNEVPYGGTAYGIEEASQSYFGKSVKNINLSEAAFLAGLPAAPTKYSPWGANPQLTIKRQHQVLDRMVEEKYISNEEANKAKKEKIILASKESNIKAPHFVMYVKDLLVEKYGSLKTEQGGLQVTTSLDLGIQNMAQEKVSEEVEKLSRLQVGNGAALVTNPLNGDILAMVGSKDYFNLDEDGNVNVTTSLRQPGSAIKIITYALALSNGFSPSSIISDTPITYKSAGSPPYSPTNYDKRFHGNVTLRTALASSYNVPAVKTLAQLGVNKMIKLAKEMGITTWEDSSRFGLSLTLGGGEVKMTDLSTAYSVLANQGQKVDLNPILKVTDSKGKLLEEKIPSQTKVLSQEVAFLLTDILADNQARTPAFGPSSYLNIPGHQAAVKTGTTNDKRDNWTIGYTKDYLTAVWVGNNDNSPMSAVASGITGASPIWHNIMVELLKDQEGHEFLLPDNLIKVKICAWNGLLPCEYCPTKEEYFTPGTEPKLHCSSEAMKKIREEKDKKEKEEKDRLLEGVSTQR